MQTTKYDFYCEEAISGKTKIKKVYESDNVLAFYHTKPTYETHIVITSKKHILDLPSFEDSDMHILNEIMNVARDLSKKLDKDKGIRLITNTGLFQDTPHVHFHLVVGNEIPRT